MWPFSRGSDDSDERPPKPEPEQQANTYETEKYAVTLDYRNGDTERVDCYGWEYSGGYVVLQTDPYPYGKHFRHHKRHVSEEVLARDPVQTRIGTDAITVEWTKDYHWRYKPTTEKWPHEKAWVSYPKDAEIHVEPVEENE